MTTQAISTIRVCFILGFRSSMLTLPLGILANVTDTGESRACSRDERTKGLHHPMSSHCGNFPAGFFGRG
eukprot:m.694914 g.694914  ORF g.694914 m.694914 type:complete len:70 (-) comp22886_c0_seq1:2353-2562(-)